MSARRNLFIACSVAIILHCIGAICINYFFRGRVEIIEPVFKSGESSLELTIEYVEIPEPEPPVGEPVAEKHEPELATEPETSVDEPALEKVPEQEEISEPEPREDNNADLLEKGVKVSEAFADAEIRAKYPLGSRLRGEEGRVEVTVTLGASGRAVSVEVLKTSGFSSLDRAAVRAMREARFRNPSGGSTAGVEISKTFRFVLSD